MKTWYLLLLACLLPPLCADSRPRVSDIDRVRLAEVFRLADALGDSLWKGWSNAPFAVLLVTHESEFLIRHPKPSDDFINQGYDSLLKSIVYMRERKHPISLLATFPAIEGSVVPTIVVGQAESTSAKTSTPWVITLLHEHFHQWQMSQPGYFAEVDSLKLSHGDASGMWMLNFPFPYDSTQVQTEFKKLCETLVKSILPMNRPARKKIAQDFLTQRDRFARLVGDENDKYISFQFWQEGIARYTEYRMTRMSASMFRPSHAFASLADFTPLRQAADSMYNHLIQQLTTAQLGKSKRELVYPFGAVEGLLLDNIKPDWHAEYLNPKFSLERYFPSGRP